MKKIFFTSRFSLLVSALLVAMTMVSCSESDEEDAEYANWEARNNEYFESIYQQAKTAIDAGDNTWMLIKSYSKSTASEGSHTDYIVVHVKDQKVAHDEKTTTMESPLFTDSVRVHYRGFLMPSASYVEGKQFDSSWQGDYDASTMIPSKFAVNYVVNGFSTALMNMHVGDRWEVYIPWQLGYGSSSSSTSIPNCSTLRFDMTLHSFGKPGTPMPAFK